MINKYNKYNKLIDKSNLKPVYIYIALHFITSVVVPVIVWVSFFPFFSGLPVSERESGAAFFSGFFFLGGLIVVGLILLFFIVLTISLSPFLIRGSNLFTTELKILSLFPGLIIALTIILVLLFYSFAIDSAFLVLGVLGIIYLLYAIWTIVVSLMFIMKNRNIKK